MQLLMSISLGVVIGDEDEYLQAVAVEIDSNYNWNGKFRIHSIKRFKIS